MYINYTPVNKRKVRHQKKNNKNNKLIDTGIHWWLTEAERWGVGEVSEEGQKVLERKSVHLSN